MRHPNEPRPTGSRFLRTTYTWVYLYRCAIDACRSIWCDTCVVALVRSFHDRRLKCLTNSTASRAAVLGIAAAITTIWQRRVTAHAQVRLSKCGRNLVQGSRRAVGVTYAPSFPRFAACGTSLSGPL